MSRMRATHDEQHAAVAAACQVLIDAGRIAPVELASEEASAWLDCELATFAEHRLGDATDPRRLDAARRRVWLEKGNDEPLVTLDHRQDHERSYWLVDQGRRVGTVGLSTSTNGGRFVRLASLYVYPDERGRSLGRGVIEAVREALAPHGLGVRLSTSWSWQPAVRLYLRMGMWVYMWKRDLDLFSIAGAPTPIIDVGAERASLRVVLGEESIELAAASREGDLLRFEERRPRTDERLAGVQWHADSTLALALAVEGWPLVRSEKEWEESHFADGGPPEALAYKITIWEAFDRERGYRVETPRIPGLSYPTWGELEAGWAEEEREITARSEKAP